MRDDFGVFILSNGRPQAIGRYTIRALRKAGYSGKWWIVLDSEDETAPEYRRLYGEERVLTFDRADVDGTFDIGDNGGLRGLRINGEPGMMSKVVVHARNAVPRLAADLGLRYYQQLDDDYTYFAHRLVREGTLTYAFTYNFDTAVDAFVDFLEETGALTVAFAQGGDFIGGAWGGFRTQVTRKAMNTFIARVDRPVGFVGRINEDVNTYVWRGGQGDLFLTYTAFALNQINTQEQPGGLTTAYLDGGTYVKSFYTIMFAPSCVRISAIGDLSYRIHHQVSWNNAVPKVLSDRYRAAPGEGTTRPGGGLPARS